MSGPSAPRAIPPENPLFFRSDWVVLRKRVVCAAYTYASDKKSIPDFVSSAILTCLQDVERTPWLWPHEELAGYLVMVTARESYNRRRHEERFPKVRALEDVPHEESDEPRAPGAVVRASGKNPEEAYLAAEEEHLYRRRLEALSTKLAGEELPSLLVRALRSGEDSPLEVARRAGFDKAAVQNARKRLARAAQEVLDEEPRPHLGPEEKP